MEFKEQIQRILENVPKVYEAGSSSIKNEVANALKGSASGEAVALKDVSPIEHNLGVRVESKNKINAPDKTVSGTTAWYSEKLGSYDLPNGTYTFSCDIEKSASAIPGLKLQRLKDGSTFKEHTVISNGKMITSFTVDDSSGGGIIISLYSNLSGNAVEASCTYSNIQVELGTTATPYAPYIADTSGVKVMTYGGNLLDVSKTGDTTGNNFETYDKETNTITAKAANYAGWGSINTLTPLLPAGTYTMFKGKEYRSEVQLFNKNLEILAQYPNCDLSSRIVITVTEPFYLKAKYFFDVTYPYTASATAFKLVVGDVSEAAYEPYKEPIEYSQGEDIKSIYPTTTIMTDTEGAVVEVEYNRDLNKAFAELYQAIISLGGNV